MTWKPLPQPNEDRDPQRIGPALDKVARRLGTTSATALHGLFERWEELVGAGIAGHSKPISLKNRQLLVEVDSNAWATQLRYMTTELVERCCAELGAGAVRKIEIRVARR